MQSISENIGKAAKLSNLTVKPLWYYADIGLEKPLKNNSTGYRDFSDDDVVQLQFVAKARKFNFSIQVHEELLFLYSDKNGSSKEVKARTVEKISQIDNKLIGLKSLNYQLSFLADNSEGNDRSECPTLCALSESWNTLIKSITNLSFNDLLAS